MIQGACQHVPAWVFKLSHRSRTTLAAYQPTQSRRAAHQKTRAARSRLPCSRNHRGVGMNFLGPAFVRSAQPDSGGSPWPFDTSIRYLRARRKTWVLVHPSWGYAVNKSAHSTREDGGKT